MGSKTEYLIGFIMTLVLSAIFVFILILGIFYHKPVIYDREVVGTVIGQVRYHTWEASYTVEGNQTFQTQIGKGSREKGYTIGDTVRILYESADPEGGTLKSTYLEDKNSGYGNIIVLGLILLMFNIVFYIAYQSAEQ